MEKIPHLQFSWARQHKALHGATLTVESGSRCSMCQASVIDSDKPLMYVWRLKSCTCLAILFHTWTGLLLDEPAVVVLISCSTGLTVNEERLCIPYIKVLWQLHTCGPSSGVTGHLGTELCVCVAFLFIALHDVCQSMELLIFRLN